MAIIKPFRGVRYNPKVVGDLQKVIAPPYDVISPELLKSLQQTSDYNIVHIDLPKEASHKGDPYIQAGECFRKWLAEEAFIVESKPSFYVYQQRYTVPGTTRIKEFLGFLCIFSLAEWSEKVILPHEHTFAKPKEDRLNLMRASSANFSPIYSFYHDPSMQVEKALTSAINNKKPEIDVKDENGEEHRIWVINDPEVMAQVSHSLQNQQLYIADGHHRYETALDYKREMESTQGADPQGGWNYVMMMLVNSEGGGLTVLPTHRMVSLPNPLDKSDLKDRLSEDFHITIQEASEPVIFARKVTEKMAHPYSIALVFQKEAWILEPRDLKDLIHKIQLRASDAWKMLGVTILHQIILPRGLGLDITQQNQGDHIVYTREAKEAVEKVADGLYEVACLLNGPPPESIIDVAQAGDAMPHKSTYFYPKLLNGLVLNDLSIKVE